MTKNEAIKHINGILTHKGITLQELQQVKGRMKGTLKHELVVMLKNSTNLSYRDIGVLLGLNKSTVQELN